MNVDDQAKVTELLAQGHTVAFCANSVNIKPGIVYVFAKSIGWSIKDRTQNWAEREKNWNSIKHTKKITISHEEILKLHDENLTLEAIGKIAGCTRERIRQIIKIRGGVPKRKMSKNRHEFNKRYHDLILIVKAILYKKRREINESKFYEERLNKWAKAREMWSNNCPSTEIAKEMNMTMGSLGGSISRLRSDHGWFPYRNDIFNIKDRLDPNHKIWTIARKMWDDGFTISEIQNELNKLNYNININSYIHKLRKMYDWFPYRRNDYKK